ncbi:unnamed protein product [Caenorhabditis auriculariae]|uniref:Uncharacterized protein n=1 Tax=Caenorhabditis auriculariae TaxID=2777116 RepID=A0A8S1H0C2_9PELO|nr:unnamed protein product [Caenorhabditis auriculariae]
MLTRVFVFFACLLLLVAADERPEKRPALLSRYGRAVLPRYGKRSSSSPAYAELDQDVMLCRYVNGRISCSSVDDFLSR